jgi:hypothetical protein
VTGGGRVAAVNGWLALVGLAVALAVAAASCRQDVPLGVAPDVDAAGDHPGDGGAAS